MKKLQTKRKQTDLSAPLHVPVPPLQHGGVMTGKIKGENRRMGENMAWQLGSLLPCLSQRDKKLVVYRAVCQPSFLLSEGIPC